MAGLDDIWTTTVTRNTVFPSRAGFGTPALLAYHTEGTNRVDTFGSAKEVEDAFPAANNVNREIRRRASLHFMQTLTAQQFVVLRASNPSVKTIRIYPLLATQGLLYSFDVIDNDQATHSISYTVPGAATVASVCTALAALINPLTLVNATATTTYVEITADAANHFFRLDRLPKTNILEVEDMTDDPGVAADLSLAEDEENAPDWYALTMLSSGDDEIAAAAAWIESRTKMGFYETSSTGSTKSGVTTDIGSTLMGLNYARSSLWHRKRGTDTGLVTALMSFALATSQDSGSTTWEDKVLTGIIADVYSTSQRVQLENRRMGRFVVYGGFSVTRNSKVAANDWIDNIHNLDWTKARSQEDVWGQEVAASNAGSKITYDDIGLAQIQGALEARLNIGVRNRIFAATPAPTVTVPKAAEIEKAVKATRRVPNIVMQATLAGAIHGGDITINVEL